MTCFHAVYPTLTEMGVLSPPEGPLKGYRMYRIEYGFECSCPEGIIWLPGTVDPRVVEKMLRRLVKIGHS